MEKEETNPLDNIRIVLVGTLYTGNVGSANPFSIYRHSSLV